MADEYGNVPTAKSTTLSGTPIPVNAKTAARGKKIALAGTWRQMRPAINHFWPPFSFDLGGLALGATLWSVSTPPDTIGQYSQAVDGCARNGPRRTIG